MNEAQAWYNRWAVFSKEKKEGPGKGWWAPPKGTHGTGKKPREERQTGKAPEGADTTTVKADDFLIGGLPIHRSELLAGSNHRGADTEARVQAKAEIVSTLAEKTDTPEEYVNDFVRQWAHSSNDEDMRSLAIQEDAAKEFGVPLSKFTKDRIETIDAEIALRGEGSLPPEWRPLLKSERQQAILGAMYDNTQDRLAEAGFKPGDTIRLRRGVQLPVEIAEKWNKGDVIPIKGNALQSWTIDTKTAEYFAGNWQVEGIVFEMDVPVERIVGTARTGLGCLTEGEFVIMGGAEDIGKVTYRAW